ncbi:MAG: hypothetical protein LBI79_06845 [Nitrososphaerota archaeon]|nr:hypothetical protein [Nitrososphaerota archaeon]
MLVVSSFAIVLQTANAAEPQYTVKHSGLYKIIIDGREERVTRFSLYDQQDNFVGYAYCLNMDLPCYAWSTYKPVSVNEYLPPEKADQVMAALTYITNNHGYIEKTNPIGYEQLIQCLIWKIVHGYDVTYIENGADIVNILTDVINNLDKITYDYKTGITMKGEATATPIGYGPFWISENIILSNVNYDLTFTQGGTNAIFVDETGKEIATAKPGEKFYVNLSDGASGQFAFTATASKDNDFRYIQNVNVFGDVDDTGRESNPLFQPLIQYMAELLGAESKATFYSCSSSFTIQATGPSLGPAYTSVTATNTGNRATIIAGLNPKTGNPYYNTKGTPDTPYVVPNSNHFVYAVLNRADLEKPEGAKLDMVVGNNFNVVGSATVKLVNGNIEITINGKGSFGAIAFDKIPVFNNGNIHSQKATDLAKFGATTGFNHDNKATIPCPAGNTIYLYIHCDTIQFYT